MATLAQSCSPVGLALTNSPNIGQPGGRGDGGQQSQPGERHYTVESKVACHIQALDR